jgi:hypothetical protein
MALHFPAFLPVERLSYLMKFGAYLLFSLINVSLFVYVFHCWNCFIVEVSSEYHRLSIIVMSV